MPQEKSDKVNLKMKALGVREEDLSECFVKASGPGGQNVNKISSCVVLEHKITGISVKCQQERSQALNRLKAREMLVEKIENFQKDNKSKQRDMLEKLRRKNRKRPHELQEIILDKKRKNSDKKRLRQKIKMGSWE